MPIAAMAGVSGSEAGRTGDAEGDAALVVAAKQNRQAFGKLYLRYVDPIYRYCLRRLRTKEAAEDATSQVFTKALAALPAYREDASSFRSWLFAIAHNVVADAYRARHLDASLDVAAGVVDDGPTPEETALSTEQQGSVTALLAELVPDQRRVLELRFAGLTSAEIARVLGRNEGAVRAVQFRAVARLRTLLHAVPGSEGAGDG
jgi:RNA polymerase sigma-70 factor (ECF subfamily)